jgi:hypothetical protein
MLSVYGFIAVFQAKPLKFVACSILFLPNINHLNPLLADLKHRASVIFEISQKEILVIFQSKLCFS